MHQVVLCTFSSESCTWTVWHQVHSGHTWYTTGYSFPVVM